MSSIATNKEETNTPWELQFGARPRANGSTIFRVWAPLAESMAVKITGDTPLTVGMERRSDNIFEVVIPDLSPGADYFYLINGEKERPDPVSRWQPQGVHGPSRVVNPEEFAWTDQNWKGLPLKKFIIYELHTGTFTPEGTFEAIIPKLPYLKELGITAVELMPVAEFPGGRNWGYDGTYVYAPQSTYGGPTALKRLIDACHREGLAVVMDVVYNHLGPEGNYLGEYAPVFSNIYRSPWGDALNFDGPESDGVRRFFIDNALYWLTEYHVDALRLDAIHTIFDNGPRHILGEISEAFHTQARALGRQAWMIAESDNNDVRVFAPVSERGYSLDAQWNDDFHHSLHVLLTKYKRGYLSDFGKMADLAKAITEGFVYDARRWSKFRLKYHGSSSVSYPGERFVIFIQNHDQIANSYWGDRLASPPLKVPPVKQKLAAAILLCAPNLPLLFMGQEWGETSRFLYFTSHTDKALAEAVRQGRKKEYSSFVKEERETASASGSFNDPQAPETFEQSKINWSLLDDKRHKEIFDFYCDLIALRKRHSCLSNCDKKRTRVEYDHEQQKWIVIERGARSGARAMLLCNFSEDSQLIPILPSNGHPWQLVLWSGDAKYGGGKELTSPPAQIGHENGTHAGIHLSGWDVALYISHLSFVI